MRKASFGSNDGMSFAVSIDSLSNNDFLTRSFGQQLGDLRIVQEWKKSAKTNHVLAKGKPTMAAVKKWAKENKPSEFYARWKRDSSSYKDDSVEVYYK